MIPRRVSVGNEPTMAFVKKLRALFREETMGFRPSFLLAQTVLSPLPKYVGSRLRTRVLRAFGFTGIDRSVLMWNLPTISGQGDVYSRLKIGRVCRFNVDCFLNLGAPIRIGQNVGFGHQVMILTESHPIGTKEYR